MKKITGIVLLGLILCVALGIKAYALTVDELGEIDKAGTYRVKVYTLDKEGREVEGYAMVTVTFPYTVISEENQEGIDAQDIKLTDTEQIQDLSAEELIAWGQAHAWSLSDGMPVTIAEVSVEAEEGFYEVLYSTEKGTSVKVKAFHGIVLFDRTESLYHYTPTSIETSDLYYKYLTRFLTLLLVIPVLMLIVIYWMTNRKAKKMKKVLYEP